MRKNESLEVMDDRIIPKPLLAQPSGGRFTVSSNTVIFVDDRSYESAQHLVEMLAPAIGVKLHILSSAPELNYIALKIDPLFRGLGDEGYLLQITPSCVDLVAQTRGGLFWGLQTLRQLLPTQIFSRSQVGGVAWDIPCGTIEDRPRFRWRGMMLDCSRHFMPIEFIYQWIELLAIHKMNVFHWHLTDDQGWRIEIKKYPKLTNIGGCERKRSSATPCRRQNRPATASRTAGFIRRTRSGAW